jgi:serine/threonine-protein kinase
MGDGLATAPDDRTVITNRPVSSDAPPPMLATPQTIGEALIGKQLDHYELLEFVGGGGMGAVFRANDSRLGRTVAVKVLSRDQSDEETIRRFRNEAQSAARLDHPNIARVFFVSESGGWNYIVFEFIEGINLRDLVDQRGPLSLEDALNYSLQIAEALAHSSSRDVVHRDIKPSNVLVTAHGQAKLVDMGLARLHQVESSSDDLTASGVTLGTFDYISPEQARDPRAADVRSDIYSLGCTLFYLLTGQPPFPEGTALQKLLRHNDEERPDVRQLRPDVPASVAALLAKMLAKRPSQRFQTPADLIATIVLLGQELGLPSIARRGQPVLPVADRKSQWHQAAWQIAGAVALLAVAVVVLDAFLSAGATSLDLRPQPKLAVAPPAASHDNTATSPQSPPVGGNQAISRVPGVGATSPMAVTSPMASESPAVAVTVPEAGGVVAAVPGTSAGGEALLAGPDTSTSTATVPDGAISPPPVAVTLDSTSLAAVVGGGSDLAGSLAAPTSPKKVSRLIVAPQQPTLPVPDVEYITSLAAAVRRAAELNVSEIELQWSGRQVESPLVITSPRLTLRAGAGYHPIVVFRPELSSLEPVLEMIRLAGGSTSRLLIQGAELRMELPTDSLSSGGWALVMIQTGQFLELADCVLTVQNVNERHSQVAMIDVRARRPSDTMTMGEPQPAMASPTRVSLDRCIARGAASVIGMSEETSLDVRWNQGLIVTPWQFITTGGSTSNPTRFEPIKIDLSHVTAVCRQGLYQMQRRPGTGYQLSVDTSADHCILMTDPNAALYEFIGVSDVAQGDLEFSGEDNVYPDPNAIFLRYSQQSGQPGTQFAIADRKLIWSPNEKNPHSGMPWRNSLDLSLPPHTRDKDDFEIDAAMTIEAGFDGSQLPDAAAEAAPPALQPASAATAPSSSPPLADDPSSD